MTKLPSALVAAIKSQSAVLFLGAGASIDATHPGGIKIPGTSILKNHLSDEFLSGQLKDRSLSYVAEMCISETDLHSVQSFIRDMFLQFKAGRHHMVIPRFSWHAIVTTNYDLIIEDAYSRQQDRLQDLASFKKDGQPIDKTLKKKINGVCYIKLHGCIDAIDDSDIPLILSSEQYARYSKNRKRLYNLFRDYGYEYPIIFCGYSIDDPHIQSILFDLCDTGINRPRYYYISPDITDVEQRYWESNRISCIRTRFSDFLFALEKIVPSDQRSTPSSFGPPSESLRRHYRVFEDRESKSNRESRGLKQFLSADVDHVRVGMATDAPNPRMFYLGADTGWGPIEASLDVRRRITDNVLSDAILEDDASRIRCVDLHVVKGPAGHGKSTVLRRVAWDASEMFSKLCLYVVESGSIRPDALKELWHLTEHRIFLFVDRAAIRVDELTVAIRVLEDARVPVTIITAERDNEWNVRCGSLDEYVAGEYPLRNLSEREIHTLISKLGEHKSLGRLANLNHDEQVREFLERAERQLLVALHEATLGKSFEAIVKDEYDRIIPIEAQTLYLDVCTLNRLGVPVRAGLISRVSGIRFEDFRERFLMPLQLVVRSHLDPYTGDRMYSARHPHIADLVFQMALTEPEDRYEQVIRILNGMNVDYSSDQEAFRSLIRGRSIAEIFVEADLARRFYERAQYVVGDDAHLLQQAALFEMNHPAGNLRTAELRLSKAFETAPADRTIRHTLANLKRIQANKARNRLHKNKLRQTARRLLEGVVGDYTRQPHGFHTSILVLVDELEDVLREKKDGQLDRLEQKTVVDLIREIESKIREGQQLYPDDERLLTAEAKFREIINDDDRAFEALRRAFENNRRSEWVAIRMSHRLEDIGNHAEAKAVLLSCLVENPDSKAVNFALAKLYIRRGYRVEKRNVLQYLRRSFADGDTRFDAQYWYARELFISRRWKDSDAVFSALARAPVTPSLRNRLRGFIPDQKDRVKVFRAVVTKKEEAYLFARVEGFSRDVFCHSSQVPEDRWSDIGVGTILDLEIGFSMRGVGGRLVG